MLEGDNIPNLTVHSDIHDLYKQALALFERHALKSIEARGRFCVALAGGSTPKAIYERLAKLELPWDQIHLFWGDERCVPPDDPRSNFAMVNAFTECVASLAGRPGLPRTRPNSR
jgi:6-phosphogluconolactonase